MLHNAYSPCSVNTSSVASTMKGRTTVFATTIQRKRKTSVDLTSVTIKRIQDPLVSHSTLANLTTDGKRNVSSGGVKRNSFVRRIYPRKEVILCSSFTALRIPRRRRGREEKASTSGKTGRSQERQREKTLGNFSEWGKKEKSRLIVERERERAAADWIPEVLTRHN